MRLRVLHLVSSFRTGGSERQAVQLVRLLKESGRYDLHLAALDGSGELRTEAERMGLTEIPEYPLNSFYDVKMIRQLRRFARLLTERRIDVVQTHDFYSNIFGMIGAALARVPSRIAARRETLGWRSAAQKRAERMAYRLAHAVVANAEAVKRQLVSEGVKAQKVEVVYNGLELDRLRRPADATDEATLASFGLPVAPGLRFVTIVANLRHPVKDHPTFLRAAARTHQDCSQARFIVAGEGDLTEAMRSLAADLGIAGQTFFIGCTERVAELLAISDVCVLSSQAEGFSNSILEYMAAARPAVVTDVGGAREAISDGVTGFLVPAGDHELMAERVTRLLNAPAMARAMGDRARRLVEDKFSCAAQLECTEALYSRLSAATARPAAERIDRVQREVA
ncbi:MAG: glycosyltransferase [Blastocatellia bacterium]